MNLQQLQVKIIKTFGKSIIHRNHKKFIKLFTDIALNNNEFLNFFKKRTEIYINYKKEPFIKIIGKKIIHANSKKEIRKILSCLDLESSFKVFGLLVHSYLQWKEGFDLNGFSLPTYQRSKIDLIKKIKKTIANQHYKVVFLVWGSFIMRKQVYSLFSDLDCVIVIDDKRLLQKKKIINFLREIIKEINTPHFNLPTKREIWWLGNSEGIARMGLIKEGVFVNFKIFTKEGLSNSILKFHTQALKELNQGYFSIPDFNNRTQIFSQKNSIPVYPFVKEESVYKLCRGLIPELLHTGEIVYANPSLKKELINIQKACVSKNIGFIKAYNSSEKEIPVKILRLSYTPEEEMKNNKKKLLLSFYNKIYKNIKNSVYLETFLGRLYGELVLSLLEKTSKCWSHHNLLCFFLGCPVKTSSKTRVKEAFLQYFKTIKNIQSSLNPSYIHSIIDEVKNSPDSLLKLQIDEKEKVLLATSLIDIVEKFCINRSDFYKIIENVFKKLFPREYKIASNTLKKLLIKFGGRKKLNLLVKDIEKELKKLNYHIMEIKYRIRQPAGLYQHHLMKRVPLTLIDDIISIQITYQDKDKTVEVVKTVSRYLKSRFENVKKKSLQIGKYKGHHFYFRYKKVPFEVMVRDLRSNVSIGHKIGHSINQKKYYRLKIFSSPTPTSRHFVPRPYGEYNSR